MQVSTATAAATAVANATSAGTGAAKSTLDYDAFLTLLVAQLKNQDPTKPMDPSQQMAQLASFSSVEQAIKTNAKLDSLLTQQSLSQAESLIGHTIYSPDNTVSGQVVAVKVTSDGAVALLADGQELAIGPGITVT
jgi:flagellar basal-body rod modification protein FlgD